MKPLPLIRTATSTLPAALVSFAIATAAHSADLVMVSGATGNSLEVTQKIIDIFEEQTGHTVEIRAMPSSTTDQFAQYKLWLSAGASDVDVYRTDVIWAPQLATHFIDLSEAAADVIDEHYPSIIASQTVGGKLVALPYYTDAPVLYYRADLLEKYDRPVPTTWAELEETATLIQEAERAAGNADMWGLVFDGKPYEGLTCTALEWVVSAGGGRVVETDGEISINNDAAVSAIETAAAWVGTISPPGTPNYSVEEARGVWQNGNAVFMRNWPYAYALSRSDESPVKDLFEVTTLPSMTEGEPSAATLGGWNIAVSRYSENQEAAIELALFMQSAEAQKIEAMEGSHLPTRPALYEDDEIIAAQPIIGFMQDVFQSAVPRPSDVTRADYNEVSSLFWTAVNSVLAEPGTAQDAFDRLEIQLTQLRGTGW
ncbi:MAG: ABC transporter substrate-binding protein [Paracoccaceae bacterium]|nr:ABC transporter substrate-binding protein [Paracoccaceae bacterium]